MTYVAILDNAVDTHLTDIAYDKVGENGAFNHFFDLWDDENATIDHFNNNAIQLNANVNWTGSFVFSAGNQGALNQIAPVITLRDSTITANYSNGLTVYNSNGIYVENTVLQATGPRQIYSANSTGNYQGAYLKNIYSESGPQMNPLSPARSPFWHGRSRVNRGIIERGRELCHRGERRNAGVVFNRRKRFDGIFLFCRSQGQHFRNANVPDADPQLCFHG